MSSRHSVTPGQKLRLSFLRFLTTDGLLTHLDSLDDGATGSVEFSTVRHTESVITIVKSVSVSDKWVDSSLPDGANTGGLFDSGTLFKTSIPSEDLKNPNLKMLRGLLIDDGHDVSCLTLGSEQACLEKPLVLICDAQGELHLFWVYDEKEEKCPKFEVLHIDQDANRLGEAFEHLDTKRVGVVGLGSVGSKLAVSLGRSGVRDFLLIDDDVFLPGNLCRNELDWHHIGQHKVDAVSEKLKRIAAGMNVSVRRIKLSGQEATAGVASALMQLSDCDLIIDATADPQTFNQLAGVASDFGTPLLWIEVFEGGIGGLVARYRPGKEPDPQSMRSTLNQITLELNGRPLRPATDDYALEGTNGNILIAGDADVGIITYHCARLAIDTLLEYEPSMFPYSMYLVGLAQGWCFSEPFDTRPIDVGAPSALKPVQLTDKDKSEIQDFISGIITKSIENSSST